jgi:hypothetical protein
MEVPLWLRCIVRTNEELNLCNHIDTPPPHLIVDPAFPGLASREDRRPVLPLRRKDLLVRFGKFVQTLESAPGNGSNPCEICARAGRNRGNPSFC